MDTPENKAAPRKKNLDLSSMCQSISAGRWISEEESSSAALRLILATLDSLKKGGYDIFSAQE